MLSITRNNQTEPLNQIQRFEMNEEVSGAFTVSFTSFSIPNNPGHDLIQEESIITVDGYDFRIKQLKESLNRKDILGISTFYDLNGTRQDTIYGGTHTLIEFANFVFNGTGWTFTSDITSSAFIPNFGEENVIKLAQAMCKAFECEYKILPNKQLHFAKNIGPDNDAQYRYAHNVKALSKSVDTTNMRTRIKGYGGDGLAITYTSPNAIKYGVIDADPFYDDRFTLPTSLTDKLKEELHDYPDVSIELDSIELTEKEIGERVWLLYEPMGIEFQTRVMSKKSIIRGDKIVTATVVIGNAVPRTNSDLLVSQKIEIDENKKETRSRFEQTNDRITLEVEEINTSIATIDIKADNIVLSVQSLGGRVGNAESQISIQAGQITSKVSQTDYNGNIIASLINQTATTIDIIADKINMIGITEVAHTLNIGGNFRDNSLKSINFRGGSGGVSISSNQIDDLQIGAVNRVDFNTPTINFNNADLTNFRGVKAYLSHQSGLTIEVTPTGMIVRTPSGTTKTFTAV